MGQVGAGQSPACGLRQQAGDDREQIAVADEVTRDTGPPAGFQVAR